MLEVHILHLLPVYLSSPGKPRGFRKQKELALKVVGTGIKNGFGDVQLLYMETAKIALLVILTFLDSTFQIMHPDSKREILDFLSENSEAKIVR